MRITDDHGKNKRHLQASIALTFAVVFAAGCSSGSSSDGDGDNHSDTEIDSLGRLAVYQPDSMSVSVLDLDADTASSLGVFNLAGEAPRLYSSPGNRYAVAIQRTDGVVSFIDSGMYTEDHGDHLHDYAEEPKMLDTNLNGNKPTHYTAHEDHAVIFFDADEGATSSVSVLSDESIRNGSTEAELSLDNHMHGVAKLIDDSLFVTYRNSSITDTTLPDEVDRYSFDNGAFTFEHRYAELCPQLHGSAATESLLTFGCDDGVLAINLEQPDTPATNLGNPATLVEGSRIGTMYAHHDVTEHVAVAGRGVRQYFIVDTSDPLDPYLELTMPEGLATVTQGFSHDGEVFYVLGANGELHLFNTSVGWLMADPVPVTTAVGEDDIAPVIVSSGAENHLYLLETGGQQIKVLDGASGQTLRTLSLAEPASALVWLGLADSEDHDHDHDE